MALKEKISNLFPSQGSIPERFRLPSPVELRSYLLNGELRRWEGPMQEVFSPVCLRSGDGLSRQMVGRFPVMTEEDAQAVLDAAVNAYDCGRGRWPTMPVADRIACVQQFAYRMKEQRSEVVRLLMWEIGKSLQDSEKEFDRTVDYITGTIDALKDLERVSSRFVVEQGIIGQIRRAPLGVALCMGPYNYPLNETFTTLIPALIMGNTTILKPPRHGVLLFGSLLESFRDSFPAGVVNTVFGAGRTVIPPLMASGKVDVLAFIGTSRAADALQKEHPKVHRLRSVLGLEAKNPAIVLPDADLDAAVDECLAGSLSFNGQRCTALKLVYVHRSLAGRFLQQLSDAVDALPFGMPWEPGVRLTPLPEEGKPETLARLVEDALAKGARVVNANGGLSRGTFYFPALVYPVDRTMALHAVEQFGPLLPVTPFDDVSDVVEEIVASDFGQQASVFGRDARAVGPLVDVLANQVCRVNLNAQCQRGPDVYPFTGRKDSAEATLSVSDALRCFSIRSMVAAPAEAANRTLLHDLLAARSSNFVNTDYLF